MVCMRLWHPRAMLPCTLPKRTGLLCFGRIQEGTPLGRSPSVAGRTTRQKFKRDVLGMISSCVEALASFYQMEDETFCECMTAVVGKVVG